MKKVWFIPGASRGLGVDIARAALAAGDDVVATGRDAAAVERALGPSEHLLAVALDVTRRGAAEAALERFGRIDVVVNNAGYALYGAVEEYTEEEFRRQLERRTCSARSPSLGRSSRPFVRRGAVTSSISPRWRACAAIPDRRATTPRSSRSRGSPSRSHARSRTSASGSPSSSPACSGRSS